MLPMCMYDRPSDRPFDQITDIYNATIKIME